MTITAGTRLGPYEILAPLGAGGMGEVYRARDPRLAREVAIKVLPEEFFEGEERRQRFEREARLLAALNHSAIAAIYSFEEIPSSSSSSSRHLLVMELVDGEDLAQRIASGPLPLEESLSYARQIAEALEAAHEKGIVHRDLKPANVKVTPDGKVKLLDFGLAKIFEGDPGKPGSGAGVTESPTLTARGTAAGMILGTAAYMSPEQARGKPVDKRTDVWAFGCVLYEMLTGKRAFDGETVSDVLAAVLMKEPDWSALRAPISLKVRELLRRCLQRDVKQRLRDIGDARITLEEEIAATSSSSGQLPFEENPPAPNPTVGRSAAPTSARGSKNLLYLSWVLAAAFAAAAGALALRARAPEATPARALKLAVLPPAGTQSSGPIDLSPDGQQIAFTAAGPDGHTKLYVRSLDSLEPKALPGTDDADAPFFSPDGRSIGFFAAGKLKRVDLAGGPARELADAPEHRGGSWGSQNVIVFAPEGGGAIFSIPASGGTAKPVTTFDPATAETSHRWPRFLPDGKRFLFMSRRPKPPGRLMVEAGSVDGGKRTRLVESSTGGAYARGRLYFVREATLLAQAFDLRTLAVSGEPAPAAEDVWRNLNTDGLTAYSVAEDGTLAFRRGGILKSQLTWFDRQGRPLGTVGAPSVLGDMDLSRDDRRVLVDITDPVRDVSALYVIDAATGTTRVTLGVANNSAGLFSPDGKSIAFASDVKGAFDLYTRDIGSGAEATPFLENPVWKFPESFSPDGRFLSYTQSEPGKPRDIWILPLKGGGAPLPFLQTPAEEWGSMFSPDGRFIAYVSDESGRSEVFVRAFPSSTAKWQVSTGGGASPMWRRDGKELFYLAPDRTLVAVPITLTQGALTAGTAKPLFRNPALRLASVSGNTPFGVSADGQRILAIVTVGEAEASPIVLQMGTGR
ncbi:MAG: serine/threonine-protein kinase [Acidobacteria bacterium]|nr:serine/threonine-protein kinase [Acidobacteriota bacterium]